MKLKPFLLSVAVMLTFPYGIAKVIPQNIEQARLLENAPRRAVSVASKWTQYINPKANGYWISFRERVANTFDVQITSDEWKACQPGDKITIAVLPDGTPHTLESGANVAFEQSMFVIAILLWLVATINVIAVMRRWHRRSSSGDPSPK